MSSHRRFAPHFGGPAEGFDQMANGTSKYLDSWAS
jgi:hypothetical protein